MLILTDKKVNDRTLQLKKLEKNKLKPIRRKEMIKIRAEIKYRTEKQEKEKKIIES